MRLPCVEGELLSLLLVSVLWGCTNPLLKRGTEGIEHVTETSRVSQILAELKFLFLNLKYLVPFLLNQSGSLVYYYTLSTTEAVAGMFLTMAGITLCIISSVDDKDAGKQDMTQAVH
ncbi:transmembrane protein 234 isoform X6 [Acanthopagrus latus]|uniref:transmembrane protein 234 isoform X6 n=1 Tax=Acanthopagrus latus TaxID=8177 RepID=UPI00187BDD47|nr:transmembrane protein 234 isoform X6 [Acanthopagrus latus]